MKKKLILIGLCILLIGCNSKEYITDEINETTHVNHTEVQVMDTEEWESRCWEETMWLCQEHCSKISGLNNSGLLVYDTMQFDTNNDGNFSEEEMEEWKYVLWKDGICMDECIKEKVYDCYR